MPYPEFLKAVKAKKVDGVVFQPPSGDVAYALIEGTSVRMGEGWPVEVSNSWSSPTWVVRILENEGIPYTWNFDLKAGTASAARKMTRAEERMLADRAKKAAGDTPSKYDPNAGGSSGTAISALSNTNAKTGQAFTAQPKMYGGADSALDESSFDWANNGLSGLKPLK